MTGEIPEVYSDKRKPTEEREEREERKRRWSIIFIVSILTRIDYKVSSALLNRNNCWF